MHRTLNPPPRAPTLPHPQPHAFSFPHRQAVNTGHVLWAAPLRIVIAVALLYRDQGPAPPSWEGGGVRGSPPEGPGRSPVTVVPPPPSGQWVRTADRASPPSHRMTPAAYDAVSKCHPDPFVPSLFPPVFSLEGVPYLCHEGPQCHVFFKQVPMRRCVCVVPPVRRAPAPLLGVAAFAGVAALFAVLPLQLMVQPPPPLRNDPPLGFPPNLPSHVYQFP